MLKLGLARNLLQQFRLGCSFTRPIISSFSSRHDPTIEELNKEMESIFGVPPAHSLLPSTPAVDEQAAQELPALVSSKEHSAPSHVDDDGKARMVDISSKEDSKRIAVASCRVLLGKHAFGLVAANQMAKGDVLRVAEIAGIQAAKQTSSLIPLCHNIGLARVSVELSLNERDYSVEISGEAVATAKTGVEMEAMTAVAIAGLTVYDMCKSATKGIQITNVRLEHKTGGKSGSWSRKLSLAAEEDDAY